MKFVFKSLLCGFLLVSTINVFAEPYLAVRSNQKCSSCHVNPLGGGARNEFGTFYGSQILPSKAGSAEMYDNGKLSEMLRLGADLRVNTNYQNTEDAEHTKGFETQSGQVYITMQPKGLPLTLYFDQQFAPGSAINREAWMLMKLGETQHYLKAGTLMLPFGYRIEDDTSFVRTMSRKNFDSNDTGMELGLEYSTFTVNFAVSNGSTSSSNPDNKLSYASRVEWLGNNIRAGVSALTNTTEQVGVKNETQMFALFAGANIFGFNLLFEVDQVNEESQGQDVSQLATLAEINREIAKGYNIKFTTEWWDPDTDIDNDHRTRNSLLLEATPYASLQVRGGLRIGEDIPQRASGNYEQLFLQFHFYY